MQVIKPVAITDAMLASSNISEPDAGESAYVAGTTYAAGAYVVRTTTHRKYRSLVAGNVGNTPESSPTYWEDVGPTNKWAMFDGYVSTVSTRTSPITVSLTPGLINAVAVLGMVGNTLTVTLNDGVSTVYSKTVNLVDGTPLTDWYSYFFSTIDQVADVVLRDVPTIGSATLTVSLSKTSGSAQIGVVAVGQSRDLGALLYGVKVGIIDYSKKATDLATGQITLDKRAWSKRLEAKTQVSTGALDALVKLLTDLRATPVVWVGTEDDKYEALRVFGFYRDFSVDLSLPTVSYCSLTIEGMN